EHGVVVKHLLEMRHEPAFIHRIAGEAAAQMIVDSALAHMIEGTGDGPRIAGGGSGVRHAQMGAPEKGEKGYLGKFRRTPYAAVHGVHEREQAFGNEIENFRQGLAGVRTSRLGGKGAG